uniref:Zinc transporter 7 (Trinotate prediction) n=1 Tax=Henneguya salminicola TaxID=69463 RepID=A0A6G3MGA3_HENSL
MENYDSHSKVHNHSDCGKSIQKQENQIMRGVLLHIMADTLGSVAVIISSFLVTNYELHKADTICSIFCSIMIFTCSIPLIRDSVAILMERLPVHIENEIKQSLLLIKRLPGIYQISVFHTWTIGSNSHYTCMSITMAPTVDPIIICNRIKNTMKEIGVENTIIETIIAT